MPYADYLTPCALLHALCRIPCFVRLEQFAGFAKSQNCPRQPVCRFQIPASSSEPRGGAPLAEGHFAGCIFGDMFFQFFTPQGLKRPAAAIQRIHPGKVRMLAQQITEINHTGGDSGVFRHFFITLDCQKSISVN